MLQHRSPPANIAVLLLLCRCSMFDADNQCMNDVNAESLMPLVTTLYCQQRAETRCSQIIKRDKLLHEDECICPHKGVQEMRGRRPLTLFPVTAPKTCKIWQQQQDKSREQKSISL